MGKRKKSKGGSFLMQGSILAAAGIITKIIGAVYRIPMLNIMGLKGQGYYDMAFQVYSIALIISSYSLPVAVSKLVSLKMAAGERKNAFRVLKASLIIATLSGVTIMVIVFFGAEAIAEYLMGAKMSCYSLKVLAPGLLICAIMAVFRGYFQGMGTMIPTAISQIIEQLLNAIVSVVGAAVLLENGKQMAKVQGNNLLGPAYSAAGGTLGTVAGALLGLLFLLFCYVAFRKPMMRQMKRDTSKELDDYRAIFKLLILTIAPIILSTTIYNSANVIDSAMFNKIMGAQGTSEAVCAELLGKLGQYYTLFNVPLAVASALGSSVIPGLVSAAENHDRRLLHNRIYTVIRYTMLIAIPSAFGFFALGQPIMDFLWPNVDNVTQGIMLKIGAISLVFYSLSTVTNTVLQGLDRMMEPVKNAMVSLILHIVSLFIMLVMFKWGIYALIGSKIVFSLCMCIMNAHDIREACGYLQESRKTFVIPSIAGAVMAILAWAVHFVLDTFIGGRIATLIALIVAVAVYAVVLLKMGGMSEKELLGLPKGRQIVIVCKKCHLLKERRYY